jgi:hypothetical protein
LPEHSHLGQKSNSRRRRPQEGSVGPQPSIDKSVRKREQREREKEQQKQLLAKLIEIFGTCSRVSLEYIRLCDICAIPTLLPPTVHSAKPADSHCRGRWRHLRGTARTEKVSLGRFTFRFNTDWMLLCWLAREMPS